MKFTKHQKEIIKGLNSGKIYDIYSYLEYFNMLVNFKTDRSKIEAKFQEEEKGKTYKVLKPEIHATSAVYDSNTQSMNFTHNKLEDCDFDSKPATLVFNKTIKTREYHGKKYTFDPCNENGINITHSYKQIKEFMAIVSYLHKELYVLEVPKTVRKEEIGLFFKVHKKEIQNDNYQKKKGFVLNSDIKIPLKIDPMFMNFMTPHSAPEVDANKYIDEVLEFNEDAFIICDYYLDKKILSTPELELFISRHFKTTEQLNFYKALIPAYLAIVVSILLPYMQKQDNTEIIKIQQQLRKVYQELSEINTTNSELGKLNDKFNNINTVKYDDTELKNILIEINKQLAEKNQ